MKYVCTSSCEMSIETDTHTCGQKRSSVTFRTINGMNGWENSCMFARDRINRQKRKSYVYDTRVSLYVTSFCLMVTKTEDSEYRHVLDKEDYLNVWRPVKWGNLSLLIASNTQMTWYFWGNDWGTETTQAVMECTVSLSFTRNTGAVYHLRHWCFQFGHVKLFGSACTLRTLKHF